MIQILAQLMGKEKVVNFDLKGMVVWGDVSLAPLLLNWFTRENFRVPTLKLEVQVDTNYGTIKEKKLVWKFKSGGARETHLKKLKIKVKLHTVNVYVNIFI